MAQSSMVDAPLAHSPRGDVALIGDVSGCPQSAPNVLDGLDGGLVGGVVSPLHHVVPGLRPSPDAGNPAPRNGIGCVPSCDPSDPRGVADHPPMGGTNGRRVERVWALAGGRL